MMPEEEEPAEIAPGVQSMEDALRRITEHFPDVLILASTTLEDENDGDQVLVIRGTGNYFARLGMAAEYINTHREK